MSRGASSGAIVTSTTKGLVEREDRTTMQRPTVTEISALSAHRREVALVRWPLTAVPDRRGEADPRDPLRSVARAQRLASQACLADDW
jgi:hypothetical protein